MKTFLLLFSLCTFISAGGNCADCVGSEDACRPRPEKLTPFMAELKKAAAAPEKAEETVKNTVKKADERAAVPKTSAAAPATSAADTPLETTDAPPEKKEVISRPGWLVAAVLFLYGLYYFLKEGKKRKGKK